MNHSMRLSLLASAVCLCLHTFAGAESQPAAADSTAAQSSAASNEAAAKHAKRTACLKEAKDKKLIGASKNAFLKSCLASPTAGP